MSYTGFLQRGVFAFMGFCALALALAPAVHAADKSPAGAPADAQADENDRIIAQARASYYSLKQEGMAEFRCRVVPNFAPALEDLRKTNAAEADRRAKIFAGLRFDVTVPIDGLASVTHSYDGEIPADLTANFDKIYHGVDQAVRGFAMTWKGFMVNDMFPKLAVPYTLDRVQSGYRIYYLDQGAGVTITMGQDMAMSNVKVSAGALEATIIPHFGKVGGKLLLVGYDAVYQGPTPELGKVPDLGKAPDTKVEAHMKIDNQLVDGFQIPGHFELQGTFNGKPVAMGMTFTDCHTSRREAIAPAVKK